MAGKKSGKSSKKGSKKGSSKKLPSLNLPALPKLLSAPSPSPRTQTLLFTVSSGDETSLTRMVGVYGFGSNLKEKDTNGATALHIAVRKGDIDLVKRLLSFPEVPLNATEDPKIGGFTALHAACQEGKVELVQLLLNAGANPNIKSTSPLGESPLHICCKHDQSECAKALLAGGALADCRDAFGHNPSFWANSKLNGHMIKDLSLPPIHRATPQEHFAMMCAKNPKLLEVPGKKKKGSSKNGDKKKKKKK